MERWCHVYFLHVTVVLQFYSCDLLLDKTMNSELLDDLPY